MSDTPEYRYMDRGDLIHELENKDRELAEATKWRESNIDLAKRQQQRAERAETLALNRLNELIFIQKDLAMVRVLRKLLEWAQQNIDCVEDDEERKRVSAAIDAVLSQPERSHECAAELAAQLYGIADIMPMFKIPRKHAAIVRHAADELSRQPLTEDMVLVPIQFLRRVALAQGVPGSTLGAETRHYIDLAAAGKVKP